MNSESRTKRPHQAPRREHEQREPPTTTTIASPHPKGPHPRNNNDPEHKIAGRNACLALFAARPDDVRRVYLTEENVREFGAVLRYCAQNKIAYHIKTSDDLTQIAETVHHDGVLFLARQLLPPTPVAILAKLTALPKQAACAVVVLEDVKNPHNVGAILRVCAHFGVQAVLAVGSTAALSPAVMRTAEGGAETVPLVQIADGQTARRTLEDLRASGFVVVATSSHANKDLLRDSVSSRCVFMFGSEADGLSDGALRLADQTVQIPGAGTMESLNVACAASVVLWEHHRSASATHRPAATRRPS